MHFAAKTGGNFFEQETLLKQLIIFIYFLTQEMDNLKTFWSNKAVLTVFFGKILFMKFGSRRKMR